MNQLSYALIGRNFKIDLISVVQKAVIVGMSNGVYHVYVCNYAEKQVDN